MPKVSSAGDWPARPFDPKCKERGPLDEVVVGQIRCVIHEWHTHDWAAVRAILETEVPSVAGRLETLTVREIGQYFHAIAHRGQGPRHTADTTVVQCPPIVVPAGSPWAPADVYAAIVRRLERNPRIVLKHMHTCNAFQAVDKLTRPAIVDGTGLTLDHVATALEKIRDEGKAASLNFLESSSGRWSGGSWLTPDGKLLAERVKDADEASKPLSLKRAQ